MTSHDPDASGRPRATGPLEIVLEELAAVVRQADELAIGVAEGDADAADRAARPERPVTGSEAERGVAWSPARLG